MRQLVASILVLLAVIGGVAARQQSPPLKIHSLDANDLASATQWQFLASGLQDIDVVALPEPIHMTHEFPIVRLGIIKFLNERMGFHVLGMEGSLVDAWATQDRFLASSKSEQDAADAQLALFPLWNTPEIRQLFQYEAASWGTPTPLYVTAYDVQPGVGKGTNGVDAFRLLADRLATYSPPPASLQLDSWLSHVRLLTGGCKEFKPADIPAITGAIDLLASWIATAGPAVAARFPNVPPHAESLKRLPTNLRGSLALCSGLAASPSANYKALRDREGAAFAETLREMTATKKLMLWAHWSHLAYDDPAAGLSVGRELRQKLGTRLYTILPVAERGSAIVIFPSRGSDEDIGVRWMRPGSDQFSKRMRALSSTSFFLDLRDPAVRNDAAFAGNQSVWIESRLAPLSLLKNTDAIVWLERIGPPQLPLPVLLILGGMHYRWTLALSASLVVVLGLSAMVWRWRKRRVVTL
jgi:erythromycin esterase-like protein